MKSLLLYSIVIMSFFFLTTTVSGQIIKGMVIAGANLTQVEGDETKGWNQIGFNGGLGAIIPFGKDQKWGINIETLFSQKGSFQKGTFDMDSITNEYRLRLNYFEVPLYVTFSDKDVVSFGLGGYYAQLVSYNEVDKRGMKYPYSEYPEFRSYDLGFLIDAKVRIWKHLHVNVRYSQTIGFIRTMTFYPTTGAPYTRKQLNQVISLRFVYIFNEGQRGGRPQGQ